MHCIFTHWLLELFAKNAFLDMLVVFGLDLGQISLNHVENAFKHNSLSFLPPALCFTTLWLGHVQKSEFLHKKMTYVFRLFDFWNFFSTFPFSPFLFFLLQWLAFYWACLQLKKLLRKRHRDGKFSPWSSSEFLTQLFEHFCAYLRLH